MILSSCLKRKSHQFEGASRALLSTAIAELKEDISYGNEERKKKVWERRQIMQALTALHRPSLPASDALLQGKLLHDLLIRDSFETELFLINNLLSIYASCGFSSEASHLFNSILKKNVVSWTTMISCHAQHGSCTTAFEYFHRMQKESIRPNQITLVSLLTACCHPDYAHKGYLIHFLLVENSFESHVITGTALVRMYCNCSTLENAYNVFNTLIVKDSMAWTIMLAAYVNCENGHEALVLFGHMQQEGMMPNNYTYNKLINACATVPSFEEGRRVHSRVVGSQFEHSLYIQNALLDMYAKCGSLQIAHKTFLTMPEHDLISWNAIITAFAQHALVHEVFKHFDNLKLEGFKPDEFTYSCLLNVCTNHLDLNVGRNIHEEIRKAGLESRLPIVNALLDMYAKCGCVEEAHILFDKMGAKHEVSWTTRAPGIAQKRLDRETPELSSCMPGRNVFSWTSLIQGYAQYGHHHQALKLFVQMQGEGVWPNHITLGVVVGACAGLLDVEKGREIHVNLIEDGYEADVNAGNALVDMYARCGSLIDARRVFDGMPYRDAVSWNTMIGGYAEHGSCKEAFEVSLQMQSAGLKPDEFTFTCVLSACRHAGLVVEACHFFNHMLRNSYILATVHHYASIIDLLGRAGCLLEAEDFINKIPFQPNVVIMMSILSACKSHSDTNLAERFSDHILDLAPTNAAAHVLLSNIFYGTERLIGEEEFL